MKAFQGMRTPTPRSRKIAGMIIRDEGDEQHRAFRLVVDDDSDDVLSMLLLLDQKAKKVLVSFEYQRDFFLFNSSTSRVGQPTSSIKRS